MLIRVFEIPKPTGTFHFGGGEPQTFVEVDWFRDDPNPMMSPDWGFDTPEGCKNIETEIRGKHYYRPDRAYLVLHPLHPFTINYDPDKMR
jgi:hypothetical protein